MLKIITVIYILCAVYTSSPDITSPAFLQNISSEIQSKSLQISLDLNRAENVIIPETVNIDCIEELKTLGFFKEESKNRDLNTRNAVIRFQSSCNMSVTGNWDKKCMDALIKRIKEKSVKYSDIVAAAPSEGKWFTINKTKRILTFYENKKVNKKYPVAVGNPPSLTVSGKYTITSRVINPTWGGGGYAKPVKGGSPQNPLGYRWMGLSYKDGTRLGIHGNNSPSSIGKNISHGCIRMINSDIEELFKLTPLSVEVWIGTEKELEKWGIVQDEY